MDRSTTPPLKDVPGHRMTYIPPFNPKTSNRSLEEWLKIVKSARNVWNWSEIETIQRAGAVLEGDAAKWYIDWLSSSPTWNDFEECLSRRCKVQYSYMTKFKKAIAYSSSCANTFFEYCIEKDRLLKSVLDIKSEENCVEIIIDGIEERGTKNHLLGLMIKSVSALCDIISRFEDRKAPKGVERESQSDKNSRGGIFGQKRQNTTSDRYKNFREKMPRLDGAGSRDSNGCFVCGSMDHYKSACPKNP